ncbi:zinc finger HIT domain-containing protein 3-like [Ciona intestinalis]
MTVKPTCQVCNENQHKYKCPQCYKRYCSVDCYKKHKSEDSCQVNVEKPPKNGEKQRSLEKQDEETEKVSEEVLERLKDSKELKDILKNPHLRKLLTEVDKNENTPQLINDLMQEPIFIEFADQCLDIIH